MSIAKGGSAQAELLSQPEYQETETQKEDSDQKEAQDNRKSHEQFRVVGIFVG